MNKKMTALILAATLGGCADVDMGGMNREEMLGTAAGAAVGGILYQRALIRTHAPIPVFQ